MAPSAEPEDEMLAVGNELLNPPADEDSLLELLGRAEQLLSKVEQSPQPSMTKALDPAMKGLVANELLRHPNADVKVAVASCISEITRITAPEAPYDDDLMKAIFELIVEAFGGLNESPQLNQTSYRRRLSILETVAKVRSCVVMLDLECDGLILEMFRHFFRARRGSHPDNAYSLIETIMTVVVEESEDFSSELIACLLDNVKKDNKDASRELGERVIARCGSKLKPYLLKELQSRDAPLSGYSRILATICHKSSDALENTALGTPVMEDDSKLSERTVSEELQQESTKMNIDGDGFEDIGTVGDKPPEPVLSNGVARMAQEPAEPASPSIHSEQAPHTDSKAIEASITKSDDHDSLGGKAHKISRQSAKKLKNRKDSSLVKSLEVTDHSPMDTDKDSAKHEEGQQKKITSDKTLEPDAPFDDKLAELHLSEEANDQSALNSDPSRPKRGRPRGPKGSAKKGKGGLQASPSSSRKVAVKDEDGIQLAKSSNNNIEVEGTRSDEKSLKSFKENSLAEGSEKPSPDAPLKKEEEKLHDSEVKTVKKSGKKSEKMNNIEPSKEPQFCKEEETHNSEVAPAKKSEKKSEKLIGSESSKEPQIRKGRPRKSGAGTEKDAVEKNNRVEASSPPEVVEKANVEKDQSDDVAAKKSRKKHAQEENEEPKELGESMIGSSICVWWPDDKKFYPGSISAYDPSTKKHTVTYEDGDVEVLLLKNECWKPVKSRSSKDETVGKSGEAALEESFETPQKKQAKVDSSQKRRGSVKVKSDVKLGNDHKQDADVGEASTKSKHKSGGLSSKHPPGDSGKKSKDKTRNISKTETAESAEARARKKEKTPKHQAETKEETTTKSRKKSKEPDQEADASTMNIASPSSKSEQKGAAETAPGSEALKPGRKSKGGSTPKSGSRSAANGGSSTKEVSSPKAQGAEDFSPKAHEGSRKRGRPPKS